MGGGGGIGLSVRLVEPLSTIIHSILTGPNETFTIHVQENQNRSIYE